MFTAIDTFFDSIKDYGAIFIRLLVGLHLIYGVQDNVLSWDRMLEFRNFLEAHHFALPLFCAILSVYAQLICGVLFIIGAFARIAAGVMIINFLLALLSIHLGDSYPQAFPALAMLAGSLLLLFNGAGSWSADSYRKKLN